MINLPNKNFFRVSEVALYYSVTRRTVYTWIERGCLEVVITPIGRRMITRESLDRVRFMGKDGLRQ